MYGCLIDLKISAYVFVRISQFGVGGLIEQVKLEVLERMLIKQMLEALEKIHLWVRSWIR